MASSPSLLKRSILSLLARIPEENVFRPGYNFPGAMTTILNERFESLEASSPAGLKKLPEYDERVLKSMEHGLKEITEDRWKKTVSELNLHFLLPSLRSFDSSSPPFLPPSFLSSPSSLLPLLAQRLS